MGLTGDSASVMMWGMDRRGTLTPARLDTEFQGWLRATASRKGLTQADVHWQFPFQVHPKTIESWFSGRTRPTYHQFVGLCVALGELPPVLQELCPHASSEPT